MLQSLTKSYQRIWRELKAYKANLQEQKKGWGGTALRSKLYLFYGVDICLANSDLPGVLYLKFVLLLTMPQ